MTTPTIRTLTEIAADALVDKAIDYAGEKLAWFHAQRQSQDTTDEDPKETVVPLCMLAVQDSFLDEVKVKLIKKKKWSYKFPGDKFMTTFALKWIDGENKVYAYDRDYVEGREVMNNTSVEGMFLEKDFQVGSLKALLGVVGQECGVEDPVQFAGAFFVHIKSLYKDKPCGKTIQEHYLYMMSALKFAELSDSKIMLSTFPQIGVGANSKEALAAMLPLIEGALKKKPE